MNVGKIPLNRERDYLSMFKAENPRLFSGILCQRCWTIRDFNEKSHICKPKLKLYLAHPFNIRKFIREWELDFEERTEIELVNPFYDVKGRQEEEINAVKSNSKDWRNIYHTWKNLDEKKLVITDINNIIHSDGVSVILGKGYGTTMEMVYAKLWGKATYTWARDGEENHPWIKFHSDYITPYLNNLETKLIEVRNNKIR